MECSTECMRCLFDHQYDRMQKFTDPDKKKRFLCRVLSRLGRVTPEDTAPFLVSVFESYYEEIFGEKVSFTETKRDFNQFVLQMVPDLRARIWKASDPLKTALVYARLGNYIDFGALKHVDKGAFLALFDNTETFSRDEKSYARFCHLCQTQKTFLLIADNCGEIVLDRLFVEVLKETFPHLSVTLMVKKHDALNDATRIDAAEAGFSGLCQITDTGNGIPGADPAHLSADALNVLETSDVILAKGQANFETLSGRGYPAFYAFLCKCDYFSNRFGVEKFTGLFLDEKQIGPQIDRQFHVMP